MGVNTGGICHAPQSCKFIELLLTCSSVSSLSRQTADLLQVKTDVLSIILGWILGCFGGEGVGGGGVGGGARSNPKIKKKSTFKPERLKLVKPHHTLHVEDLFCLHCRL